MVKLKIEKLVEGGQGLAKDGENVYFIWNVLHDEEVEADILNKRKGIYECLAVNILKPSPHRIKPIEDHFLSCSAWSIMDFGYENNQKREIAIESYKRIAKLPDEEIKKLDIKIFSDGIEYGYRNKMEFSFIENNGKILFAFFKRGQKVRIPIDGCELATDAINHTAKKILDWINSTPLIMRSMKALIVRSNQKGETIAGLFIKDKINFDNYPKIDDKFIGFNLYYSTHKSPASVITEVLYQEGQDFLIEEISVGNSHGCSLRYGINSFFQVNIPVFEMALKDISDSVGIDSNQSVLDFYSGVGSIGLSVGNSHGCSVQLIESNAEAVQFANENIALNKIVETRHGVSIPAEKALEYINKDATIVFDPPRAGLHEKIVNRILEVCPSKIIYLSCNIATQARDIGLLKEKYDIKFIKLYNFFPRTPHIEGLCILELK